MSPGLIIIIPRSCFLYVYKDSSFLSIQRMLERLILKFYCGLGFVLEGSKSLSTYETMQLCCRALVLVADSLGTVDCLRA